jgi:hypothetical protein
MERETDELPEFRLRKPGIDERRSHGRVHSRVSVLCRTSVGRLIRGRVINLSLSGAAVVLFHDREPPGIEALHFEGPGQTTVQVGARKVHARRVGRIWFVGCAFDRLLFPNELKLLT